MTFFEEDWWRVLKNTREEWEAWRQSRTPVLDAIHTVLEVVLILAIGVRFLTHFIFHATYLDEHGYEPEYTDDDFRFNALVYPVLEPIHWRQEALMRGVTAIMGLMLLALAINPRVLPQTDMAMLQLRIYAAFTQGSYLLFDPLLGVAQRIAD